MYFNPIIVLLHLGCVDVVYFFVVLFQSYYSLITSLLLFLYNLLINFNPIIVLLHQSEGIVFALSIIISILL